MAGISSLGIGSGVLSSDLVDQLVAAERKPTESRLEFNTQRTEALLSAYGTLRSAITELRLPMRQLSAPDNMTAFSASSSNDDVAVTLDDSKASRGSYTVQVDSLAQAQSLASGTFSDKDTTGIGTGSLTLQVGDESKVLTIDGTNNTLQGLANEINDAGIGVTAGVIDTGSGFRLVMSAEETGTANAVTITASDDDGNNTDTAGLSRFVFDGTTNNLTETIVAKDAVVQVNGIQITRPTNNIENVIDGLSFELKAEGVTSNVKVEQDFGAVADRVQGFVDKFNSLQSVIKGLSGFNAETGQGALLTGDSTVRGIQNQLRNILTRVVPGLENASVRSLADAGITTDFESGNLELDRTKLEEQLKNNPDDVTALFAEQGRASDAQVEFVRSGISTEPGTYGINVTQVATRGSVSGNAALADNVTIDSTNDELTLFVDEETSVSLKLDAGTYATAQDLADQVQSQINASSALSAAGGSVQVSLNGSGQLTFTSSKYGSESNVSVTSVESGAALGLTVATGTAGVDVEGTIDGRAAEGDGQVLFLGSGNGNASGLQVKITGDQIGSRGNIQFIEGIAERTVDLVTNIVGADGALESRTEGLNKELERIQAEQVKLDERIASYRERLVSQFSAADSLISRLNSTREYVSQQLAALAPQNNRDN
ncbi:flagellar filament capping protein FliD [Marinobacter alexandrii]|uniref:flagellar filament capping protein FliD n=1 Tax=Marinobacter alexandrii TaxID=2570351 RepID=UPI001FFE707D|nr:flagellar filament capping protein FliD [Marinobacter alexandrii]MCK2150045.1 flagellar filament capping protein FliD [Marinobacter alexandrii]